ncbi:hypothetical protein U1Q18_047637 [Sarracenia purpurea var. burkii]
MWFLGSSGSTYSRKRAKSNHKYSRSKEPVRVKNCWRKRHDKDEHLQRSMKLKPKTVVVCTILSRLYDFPKPGVVSKPDGEEAEQPAVIQKLGFRSLFSLLLCDGDFGG